MTNVAYMGVACGHDLGRGFSYSESTVVVVSECSDCTRVNFVLGALTCLLQYSVNGVIVNRVIRSNIVFFIYVAGKQTYRNAGIKLQLILCPTNKHYNFMKQPPISCRLQCWERKL